MHFMNFKKMKALSSFVAGNSNSMVVLDHQDYDWKVSALLDGNVNEKLEGSYKPNTDAAQQVTSGNF